MYLVRAHTTTHTRANSNKKFSKCSLQPELLFQLDESSRENKSESQSCFPGEAGFSQSPTDDEGEDELEAVGHGNHSRDLGVVDQRKYESYRT